MANHSQQIDPAPVPRLSKSRKPTSEEREQASGQLDQGLPSVSLRAMTPNNVLHLQRAIGNQAVARLLRKQAAHPETPSTTSPPPRRRTPLIQPKRKHSTTGQQSDEETLLGQSFAQSAPQSDLQRAPITHLSDQPTIQRAREKSAKEKIKFHGHSKSIEKGNKEQFQAAMTKMSVKNVKSAGAKEQPRGVLMMGASGAGKSSMLREIVPDVSKYVHVDPDQVKEAMPQYQAGIAQGDKNIAGTVHSESKAVASSMALNAINTRRNLLFDGTGGDSGEYMMMISLMRQQGYHITLAMTHISVDEGLKRVAERAAQTGREVPEKIVRDMYNWVPKNFISLVQKVDHAYLFDNMVGKGEAPRLIWETTDGTNLKQNQVDYVKGLVAKISASKREDTAPGDSQESNTDDGRGDELLGASRRYLEDGGSSRWTHDTESGLSSRDALFEIDDRLFTYRQLKSKKQTNAGMQGRLLLSLNHLLRKSHYQSGKSKNTKTFQRRQKATLLLRDEVSQELHANPLRLKKLAGEGEQMRELTTTGFTKAFLSNLLKRDVRLLYEAHAALAHRQLSMAQQAFDLLNPVEREDTGNLKYNGNYIARSRSELHYAQQMLSAHHSSNIGGDYSLAFAKTPRMSGKRMEEVTDKYIRNKDFLGTGILTQVQDKGHGAKSLNDLVSEHGELTSQEIEAIRIYSSQKYAQMNATMHDIRLDDPNAQKGFKGLSSINRVAAAGLSKLPSYQGAYLYRGDNNFGGLLNTMRPGTIFQTPSFMSTSKAPGVTLSFGGAVTWIIKPARNSRGKDIEEISTAQVEKEVLFPPGVKLKVLDVFRRDPDWQPVDDEPQDKAMRRRWRSDLGKPLSGEAMKFASGAGLGQNAIILIQEMG